MHFDPLDLALRIPIILLALTLHEFAHALVAYRLGDQTAYRQGRVSLNPLAHLDPIGTLCLLFAPIGWAKPVPVNPNNLKHPQRDDILISAAGPLSNLVQAFIFAILIRLVMTFNAPVEAALGEAGWRAAATFLAFGVLLNVGLAVFNMIPAYPLDGFHVATNLAKGESRQRMLETARFGPFIILAIVLLSSYGSWDLILDAMYPFTYFFFVTVAGAPNIMAMFYGH